MRRGGTFLPSRPHEYEFTSQIYFDDTLTNEIFKQAPYVAQGRRTRNHHDGIFKEGGKELILPLTKLTEGYTGTFDIGLQLT
jgi:hypothetical protein